MSIREIRVNKEFNFDYKERSLVIILALFTFVTFLAVPYDFFFGEMFDFYIDLSVSVISMASYFYYKKSKNNIVVGSIMFWVIALAAFMFTLQYNFNSNIIYIILTPLIALLILPTRYVIVYIIIYQIAVAFLFWYGYNHYPENRFVFSLIGMVNYLFATLYLLAFWLFYHLAIERTFSEMKRLNREKTILLQELHHRVKNNFNLILSMLEMQQLYSNQSCNKDFISCFKSRIDSIVVAHELLYDNRELNNINMQDYIPNLCRHILSGLASDKKVNLKLNIGPTVLSVDIVIYIGIIINEMITNTLKYALDCKKGEIDIALSSKQDGTFILTYSDSGCQKLDEDSKGFGQMIIEMAAKQIGAKLEVARDNGLEYKLFAKDKL